MYGSKRMSLTTSMRNSPDQRKMKDFSAFTENMMGIKNELEEE